MQIADRYSGADCCLILISYQSYPIFLVQFQFVFIVHCSLPFWRSLFSFSYEMIGDQISIFRHCSFQFRMTRTPFLCLHVMGSLQFSQIGYFLCFYFFFHLSPNFLLLCDANFKNKKLFQKESHDFYMWSCYYVHFVVCLLSLIVLPNMCNYASWEADGCHEFYILFSVVVSFLAYRPCTRYTVPSALLHTLLIVRKPFLDNNDEWIITIYNIFHELNLTIAIFCWLYKMFAK